MQEQDIGERELASLPLRLERDIFLRTLIRELSGTLQDMVGLEEASGFLSVVGQNIGKQLDQDYRQALQVSRLSRQQVAAALVDLKQRIQGDFYIVSQNDEQIVLANRSCPFGETVLGRPAMCMMTSNIFGSIAGENLGYAKVELQQTLAAGDAGCKVVIYIQPTPQADAAKGCEYVRVQTD